MRGRDMDREKHGKRSDQSNRRHERSRSPRERRERSSSHDRSRNEKRHRSLSFSPPKRSSNQYREEQRRERIHLNTVEMTNNSNVNERDTIVTVPTKRTRNIEEDDIILPTVKKKQIREIRIREDEEGTTRVTLMKKI